MGKGRRETVKQESKTDLANIKKKFEGHKETKEKNHRNQRKERA